MAVCCYCGSPAEARVGVTWINDKYGASLQPSRERDPPMIAEQATFELIPADAP
jgi:hypothetical protein